MADSLSTSVELYRPQFRGRDARRCRQPAGDRLVLPRGDPASYEQVTYWHSAAADLQVLEALGIGEAVVLGASQGACGRLHGDARPEVVKGIVPLGTSMAPRASAAAGLGC